MDQNNKKQTVHVNRLKLAYDLEAWKPKLERKNVKQFRKKANILSEEEEENETKFGPHPLLEASQPTEHETPLNQTPINPEAVSQITDTPTSESQDPTYLPPQTPRSRGEMQTTSQLHDQELELCLKRIYLKVQVLNKKIMHFITCNNVKN